CMACATPARPESSQDTIRSSTSWLWARSPYPSAGITSTVGTMSVLIDAGDLVEVNCRVSAVVAPGATGAPTQVTVMSADVSVSVAQPLCATSRRPAGRSTSAWKGMADLPTLRTVIVIE